MYICNPQKNNILWAEVIKKQKLERYLKALLENLEVAKQKKLLHLKQKRKHNAFFFFTYSGSASTNQNSPLSFLCGYLQHKLQQHDNYSVRMSPINFEHPFYSILV